MIKRLILNVSLLAGLMMSTCYAQSIENSIRIDLASKDGRFPDNQYRLNDHSIVIKNNVLFINGNRVFAIRGHQSLHLRVDKKVHFRVDGSEVEFVSDSN